MEKQWSYSTCWWVTTSVGLQSAVSSANIGAAQQKSSNNSQSFCFCAGSYLQMLENDLDLPEQGTGFPKQTFPHSAHSRSKWTRLFMCVWREDQGRENWLHCLCFSQIVKTQTVGPFVIHRYFLFGSIKKKIEDLFYFMTTTQRDEMNLLLGDYQTDSPWYFKNWINKVIIATPDK